MLQTHYSFLNTYLFHMLLFFTLFECFYFFFFLIFIFFFFFFFSSRRRHTRLTCDWSSDVCSSDLATSRIRLRNDRTTFTTSTCTIESVIANDAASPSEITSHVIRIVWFVREVSSADFSSTVLCIRSCRAERACRALSNSGSEMPRMSFMAFSLFC